MDITYKLNTKNEFIMFAINLLYRSKLNFFAFIAAKVLVLLTLLTPLNFITLGFEWAIYHIFEIILVFYFFRIWIFIKRSNPDRLQVTLKIHQKSITLGDSSRKETIFGKDITSIKEGPFMLWFYVGKQVRLQLSKGYLSTEQIQAIKEIIE